MILNTKEKVLIYENKETIYDYLQKSILLITDELKSSSYDDELQSTKFEVYNLIQKFKQQKLDKAITEYKQSQEWDKFIIAFYGETNAGKSTIIESLRIHFQEEEKCRQQENFNKICQQQTDDTNVLEDKMKMKEESILEHKTISEQLTIDFNFQKNMLNNEINHLLSDVLKKNKSIIYKILSYLNLNYLQKRIDKKTLDLNQIESEYEEKIRSINEIIRIETEEMNKIEQEKEISISISLNLLQNYEDGKIIGDGSPDFTRKTTIYNFVRKDQEFAILDVPGIEGHETIVIDEISQAVKKAHAVFYVTTQPTPPQKGDEHKKGTLEKIKEHLGSQTEVYTIFNKRVNNPMQLNKGLVSDDENDSLKILDEKLNDILKENYAGHKIVSAKIAFLAIAKCLVINSQNYNEKKKFLDKFSTNELIEKTNFDELCNFITEHLVVNTKQKIKKSNHNKANELLNELINIVDKALKNNFEPLYKQVVQEVDVASNNLKNTLRKTKIDLDSVVAKSLRDFENDTRKEIYRDIDKNIGDDAFKSKLEALLVNNSKKMVEAIPNDIEKQMSKFQSSITESLENFKRRVDLAIQDYQTLDFGNFDPEFEINLQINNGIDKMALIGSLLGAGGLAYSTIMLINSWNLVGWAMFAIGAITVLIGAYKTFRKHFSDDYKKSEQRKAADENIENIIDRMKPKMIKNMEPIFDDIAKLIDNIVDDLKVIVTQRKIAQKHLKSTHQELVQIAQLIKSEGEK